MGESNMDEARALQQDVEVSGEFNGLSACLCELDTIISKIKSGEKKVSVRRERQLEENRNDLIARLTVLSADGSAGIVEAALAHFTKKIDQLRTWRTTEMDRIEREHNMLVQAAVRELHKSTLKGSSTNGNEDEDDEDDLPEAMQQTLGKLKNSYTPRGMRGSSIGGFTVAADFAKSPFPEASNLQAAESVEGGDEEDDGLRDSYDPWGGMDVTRIDSKGSQGDNANFADFPQWNAQAPDHLPSPRRLKKGGLGVEHIAPAARDAILIPGARIVQAMYRVAVWRPMLFDQAYEVQEGFEACDIERKGSLTKEQFFSFASRFGFIVTQTKLEELLCEHNVSEEIRLDSIQALLPAMVAEKTTREEVLAVFQVLDHNGDGVISSDDFRYLMGAVGDPSSLAEVDEATGTALVIATGGKGDGTSIDYAQFIDWLMSG